MCLIVGNCWFNFVSILSYSFGSVDHFTVTAEDVGSVTGVAIRRNNTFKPRAPSPDWHLDKVRSDLTLWSARTRETVPVTSRRDQVPLSEPHVDKTCYGDSQFSPFLSFLRKQSVTRPCDFSQGLISILFFKTIIKGNKGSIYAEIIKRAS